MVILLITYSIVDYIITIQTLLRFNTNDYHNTHLMESLQPQGRSTNLAQREHLIRETKTDNQK